MSALAGAGDPFAQAIEQIRYPLPAAPAGYKARLLVQVGLCVLLALSSLVFIILHSVYSRKIGKSIWLFKLQRVETGRVVVVNSLLVFATLSFIGAGGQLVGRWEDWRTLVKRDMPYNDTITRFVPWIPCLIQAWLFSTTNLYATVAARKKFGKENTWTSHAWVQNAVLLAAPCAIFGLVLPLALVNNNKQNDLLRGSEALLPYLKTASQKLANGGGFDLKIIGTLTAGQEKLSVIQKDQHTWLIALCAVCFALSAVVMFMNAYSLLLVLTLRNHVKANRERRCMQEKAISLSQAHEVSVDMPTRSTAPGTPSTWPSSPRFLQPFSAQSSQLGPKSTQATYIPNQNDIELQRLAADLLYGVPIILIMCITLIAGLSLVIMNGISENWVLLELTCDMFAYVYLICVTCTIWFFTGNLCRAWKSGRPIPGQTPSAESSVVPPQGDHFDVSLARPGYDLDTPYSELDTPGFKLGTPSEDKDLDQSGFVTSKA